MRWRNIPGFHGNESSRLVVAEGLCPQCRISVGGNADPGEAGALVWEVVRGRDWEHELESGTGLLCLPDPGVLPRPPRESWAVSG